MSDNVKVSVIIPVYNASKYLKICLDSLCRQSLKKIEIICIEDGSKDNSLEILKKFIKIDNRIKIIRNMRNLGAGISRNIGIMSAKGEYISILDADDFFESEMLERIYYACKENNADIGFYDFFRYNDSLKIDKRENVPYFLRYHYKERIISPKEFKENIFQLMICVPWNKMYRRDFLLESKIEFQNLHNANDVFFGNMILVQAKRLIYVNSEKALLHYRFNTLNQISSNRNKDPMCVWKALKALKQALIKNNNLELYYLSFYKYVIASLVYSLSSVTGDNRRLLYCFLQREGIGKLRLKLRREDEAKMYNFTQKYQMIKNMPYSEAIIDKLIDGSNENECNVKTYYKQLEKLGLKYGLWGFGARGKKFIMNCGRLSDYIECIIDEDPNKKGMKMGKYTITRYEDLNIDIDAIIVTNSMYIDEIMQKIKSKNIKIIDWASCNQFGLNIKQCIYE